MPAAEVWDQLGEEEQEGVVRDLGQLMRRLHALPAPATLATDWPAFMAARIRGAIAHHGAGEPWDTWIGERLAGFSEPTAAAVLLHGDLTADHLLLEQRVGRWQISGLIDFGDAKVGHPLYEFVAPLAFYTFGRPELSRALVEGYGRWPVAEVAEMLTTYCLLHEFGRLRQFLARHPVADGPAFHRALWGEG
ncbi:MAG: aminoglycoside phosphotransferase family protein [Candidatus Latescibacteria bacterium]|nr:aminoglycoside phosphotransferase family protein [Candidatus Latescibacterota bacterium]